MLFFAVADAYCRANNLDITPEADTGAGPVDFKFSAGYNIRLLVEVKLSSNPSLITGYTKQLETYKTAEDAVYATYLVIDIGNLGGKSQKLIDIKNKWTVSSPVSNVIFIDGKRQLSASKKKDK